MNSDLVRHASDTTPGDAPQFVRAPLVPDGSGAAEVIPVPNWQGSGLILVIDDHALVCRILRHVLELQGFEVLTAADGPTGLALFHQHAGEIKAVILDLVMPGMPGEEVLRAIQALRPEVRVLLLTGMPEADVKAQLGRTTAVYIQKPFQLASFIATLRRVLGD
jgi:DNA-binding response OmpR family regulator